MSTPAVLYPFPTTPAELSRLASTLEARLGLRTKLKPPEMPWLVRLAFQVSFLSQHEAAAHWAAETESPRKPGKAGQVRFARVKERLNQLSAGNLICKDQFPALPGVLRVNPDQPFYQWPPADRQRGPGDLADALRHRWDTLPRAGDPRTFPVYRMTDQAVDSSGGVVETDPASGELLVTPSLPVRALNFNPRGECECKNNAVPPLEDQHAELALHEIYFALLGRGQADRWLLLQKWSFLHIGPHALLFDRHGKPETAIAVPGRWCRCDVEKFHRGCLRLGIGYRLY